MLHSLHTLALRLFSDIGFPLYYIFIIILHIYAVSSNVIKAFDRLIAVHLIASQNMTSRLSVMYLCPLWINMQSELFSQSDLFHPTLSLGNVFILFLSHENVTNVNSDFCVPIKINK